MMRRFDAFVDRVLAVTESPDQPVSERLIGAFRLFLLAHVATRLWFWIFPVRDDLTAVRIALAAAGILALVAGFVPAYARAGTMLAAAALWVKLFLSFPTASNHSFIEIVFMTLLALFDLRSEDGRALFLQAGRWMIVIIFFYTGLQKVLYGTYFDGQFLGIEMVTQPKFTALFEWLLPEAEFGRLMALDPDDVGSGPYSVDNGLFLAMSNFVWIFELFAPLLLLVKRTRTAATLAIVAFTAAIQFGAREMMFGLLFINLALLFAPRPWNRWLLPVSLAAYAVLIGMFHFVPDWHFN